MPVDERIFGFANRWYSDAFEQALAVHLPSGSQLQVAMPPYLIATKFEAFDDSHRADGGDYLASADMNDIVALLDGCSTLEGSFSQARSPARSAVADRLRKLSPRQVSDALLNYLPPDTTSTARAARIKARIDWVISSY